MSEMSEITMLRIIIRNEWIRNYSSASQFDVKSRRYFIKKTKKTKKNKLYIMICKYKNSVIVIGYILLNSKNHYL